jgi:hypothetical protein
LEVIAGIAGDPEALQSDWAAIANVSERREQFMVVEITLVERLD